MRRLNSEVSTDTQIEYEMIEWKVKNSIAVARTCYSIKWNSATATECNLSAAQIVRVVNK